MLRPGSVYDGRFRVLENFATAANSIALAEELNGGRRVWLALLSITANAAQIAVALEQQSRFAVGVPGLARPIASGVDGGFGFVAFAAPDGGSIVASQGAAWSEARVAALAVRLASALGPLHDQGIAHGCVRPELVTERDEGDVLFGFGVAALATRFGAPGEASQLLSPSYRAPELRAALLPPTPQSDVYALGVLLRDLLLARETADGAGKNGFVPPGSSRPAVDALLAQATATEPRARPHDVRAFAAELERAVTLRVAPLLAEPLFAEPTGTESAEVLGAEPLPSSTEVLGDAPRVTPAPPPTETAPSAAPPAVALAPSPSPLTYAPFTPARTTNSGVWIALVAVIGGFLLMVGGVTGAVIFAAKHTRHVHRHTATAPTATRHLPSIPMPIVPGPSDDPIPPVPTSTPTVPKKKPLPVAHAPLVPPGLGPSTFPEEARAALPITGTEPIWGTRNAPLTWVLFGDLDDPHTRHAWRALEAMKATFGDDLRIVFRHRPLRLHPYALEAARVLAGLGRERGAAAFFNVLHKIAQDDAGLTDERLAADLSAAGYENAQISALESVGESVVAADLQLAGQFAIRETPLSFLNGMRVEGERTAAELEPLLLDERRSATWVLATGAPAKDLYATRTSGNLIGVGEQETRVCVPIADSPARGPADALVTLVEFSDFECPYCKQVEPTLKTLLARYPRTLRLVWKDYPLQQHKSARLLANFAADAGLRGSSAGFWAVHDGLFALTGAVDDGVLGDLAGKAGLDGALLVIAAHSGVHDAAIHTDMALGERLAVNGTPTFFANGRRIQGALALDQFDALIRAELASAERIVSRGVAKDKVYRLVCDGE